MWCVQRRFIGGNGANLELFTAWNCHIECQSFVLLTQGIKATVKCYIIVLVTQSCLTVCNPVDCSPPGSSVHEILQAWILEWVAMPFSRGSSWPKDGTQVSCIAGRFFTILATREYCYLNGKKHLGVTSVTGVASLPPSFRAFLFNCLISRD